MKKRFVPILLTTALILGSSMVTHAAPQPKNYLHGPIEGLADESSFIYMVDWETVKKEYEEGTAYQQSLLEGHFTTVNDNSLKIFIPDFLVKYKLSEEEIAEGYVAQFESEKDEEYLTIVMSSDFGEDISMAEFIEVLSTEVDSPINPYVVNDLTTANFEMDVDGELMAVTLLGTETGEFTMFFFGPTYSDENLDLAYLMFASIQEAD